MKKPVLLAVLGLTIALAGPARAQDSLVLDEPIERQIEFLRNLRVKGFAGLGNEYLDLLLKKADMASLPRLNLERARNAAAMAKEGKTADQKAKLLSEAKELFEPFVKANPKSLEGVQARLELAKLLSMQARVILNRAFAEEDEKNKEATAKQSRDMYDAADAELAESIKVLAALAKGSKEDVDQVQAQFDRANNLIDKAYAFLDLNNSNQNRQRAETVDAARKIFSAIAKDKDSPNGLMAHAYLIKCYQELQDPPKVEEHYGVVINATGKQAEPAQRLARYFDILYVRKNEKVKVSGVDKLKLIATECQKWIKEYPSAKRTYHGESIRFEEAVADLQIAATLTEGFKPAKYEGLKKTNPKDLIAFNFATKEVERLTKELESEGGDFADRAIRLKQTLQIEMLKLGGSKLQPKGFEGTFLLAQLEFADAKKAEKEDVRKKHLRQGLHLLQKAVAEGYQEKAPLTKVHDAQFLQGAVYLGIGDMRRGAISFEDLARTDPPSRKGAEAASYAIEIYKTFADKERDETARARLHELADYVLKQKLWADEKVIGVTRYNLGMDYDADGKAKEALDQLDKLPKDFPAYIYAQGQSMFIALKARDKAETPEEKKPWIDAARKALGRLGPLPVSADASTTLMWFIASMEGPKFLYTEAAELLRNGKEAQAEKVYQAMGKSVAALEEAFKKSGDKLAGDKKDAVEFTLHVLDKYARLGQADILYRKGEYDKVLEDDLLGSTVKEVIEKSTKLKAEEKIKVKDVRVIGESLTMALRTFVQKGNLDAAKAMYGLMLRVDSEEGGTDNLNFTRALIADLAQQVEGLKEKNDTKSLKEMVGKFAGFVDELSKQLVFSTKNPDVRDIKNLARFYESLDLYKQASELYKVVPTPKHLELKAAKFTEDQEKELISYWDLQIAYGRLLRQAKDYKESNKTLARVISHPNGKYQTLAEKEQIHIYEDMESYGTAIKLWSKYMETLQRAGLADKPYLKERYFEGYYYNALCFYKYSQSSKVKQAGKEDQFLTIAANYIVRLETAPNREGWQIIGQRFQDLLTKEKALRDKYQALKAAAK